MIFGTNTKRYTEQLLGVIKKLVFRGGKSGEELTNVSSETHINTGNLINVSFIYWIFSIVVWFYKYLNRDVFFGIRNWVFVMMILFAIANVCIQCYLAYLQHQIFLLHHK